jgi:hypothetical protein
MIGVKIYSVPEDISELIDLLKTLSFDTVFLGGKAGVNKKLIDDLKTSGISVFLVFPVFYDPDFLKDHDDYFSINNSGEKADIDWVKFVCPSRKDFLERKIKEIGQTIRKYNPTGITLDFIRFFVFWEITDPDADFDSISHGCFDACCIDSFRQQVYLPSHLKGPSDFAGWILNNRREEWGKWKNNTITQTTKRLIKEAKTINSEIKTGIHVLPWLPQDYEGGIRIIAGQDIQQLSSIVDFLSPMCYAPMCKREPEWINTVVASLSAESVNPVIPSIQIRQAYDEEPVTDEIFEKNLKASLKLPSSGVLLWSWEGLMESSSKQNILKKVL